MAQKMFNDWNALQTATFTANQKAIEDQRIAFAKQATEELQAEFKDAFPAAMQSMSAALAFEAFLANAALGALDGLSWPAALRAGAGLGDVVRRLGIRREVARENLALAFPERTCEERESVLVAHYREIGRIAAEYGRMPRLVHAPAAHAG